MLPALIVASVSTAAVFIAARRLRAVTVLIPAEPGALRAAVRSESPSAIHLAVRRVFPDEHDAAVLCGGLEDGAVSAQAVATLNEHLGDVASGLAAGRNAPRAMARAALASGTLAAVLELSGSVASATGASWAPALWEFFAGAAGAAAAFEIDRRSAVREERARAGWDEIGAVFAGRLGAGAAAGRPQNPGRGAGRHPDTQDE